MIGRTGRPGWGARMQGCGSPANTRRWVNAVLTLGQRRRRCPNVKTTLTQRLVLTGSSSPKQNSLLPTDESPARYSNTIIILLHCHSHSHPSKRPSDVGSMLGQCIRRWFSIEPALDPVRLLGLVLFLITMPCPSGSRFPGVLLVNPMIGRNHQFNQSNQGQSVGDCEPGPRFIKLKRYEISLILVTLACHLRENRTSLNFLVCLPL